jgi:hypothetical protein
MRKVSQRKRSKRFFLIEVLQVGGAVMEESAWRAKAKDGTEERFTLANCVWSISRMRTAQAIRIP